MRQVSFDTHAAARKLEQAGHSGRQAEAIVQVISDATAFHICMAQTLERVRIQVDNHMATKADIANMATKDDIAEIKRELRETQDKTRGIVLEVLRSELNTIHLRLLAIGGSVLFPAAGAFIGLQTNERLQALVQENNIPIILTLMLLGAVIPTLLLLRE